MREILKRIIREFHVGDFPELKRRKVAVPVDTGKIISITGPRRSGKTYLLFQTMRDLISRGIEKKRILYINFEDERLLLESFDYDDIFIAYKELYHDVKDAEIFVFFDEIQNLKNWEKFVRRVYDTRTKNIFITGSNSRVLSREISASLRGRAITIENLPLSFREFLTFKGVEVDLYSSKGISEVNRMFEEYLLWGGYPEIVNFDKSLKLRVLQEYLNLMLYRDIIEKYRIRNSYILKYMIKRLFGNFTREFSVNKIFNELKSRGISIGKNILYEFIEYIADNYVAAVVGKYEPSVVKQEMSNKKIYFYDNGLYTANSISLEDEKGKLLENMVFTELCRRGGKVYFYKNNFECDFLVEEFKRLVPVQVTLSWNPDIREREISGLLKTMNVFGIKEGLIVSLDGEAEEIIGDKKVKVVSVLKWLLS
ncbi:MAG: ATP-binding protein [Candidatus Marinimicrobia bacterium]|nr:ATP-binding protein [Candidatus Neomarinimicrobiota bacterium]